MVVNVWIQPQGSHFDLKGIAPGAGFIVVDRFYEEPVAVFAVN